MDTGSYMANQMDGLIESGIQLENKFHEWLDTIKKEKPNYKIFDNCELDRDQLKSLFLLGKTPIEALNDLSTIV